jgi:hypothetical protein
VGFIVIIGILVWVIVKDDVQPIIIEGAKAAGAAAVL